MYPRPSHHRPIRRRGQAIAAATSESRAACKRRVRQRRWGAVTVEFAFVATTMFTMIFGCIEFTRFSMMQSMAENAAYQAARRIIVAGSTIEEGEQEATRLLNTLGTRDAVIDVEAFNEGTEQTEIDDNTDEVRVTITIPLSSNILFLNNFTKTNNLNIIKTTTLKSERYKGYYDGQSAPDT